MDKKWEKEIGFIRFVVSFELSFLHIEFSCKSKLKFLFTDVEVTIYFWKNPETGIHTHMQLKLLAIFKQ